MGGHEAHYRPTKYSSVDDIPDSLVKTTSKRDPNNPLYKTRRWVNFKKEQILYSQRDGKPSHLRTPFARARFHFVMWGSFALLGYNIYTLNYHMNKKND